MSVDNMDRLRGGEEQAQDESFFWVHDTIQEGDSDSSQVTSRLHDRTGQPLAGYYLDGYAHSTAAGTRIAFLTLRQGDVAAPQLDDPVVSGLWDTRLPEEQTGAVPTTRQEISVQLTEAYDAVEQEAFYAVEQQWPPASSYDC